MRVPDRAAAAALGRLVGSGVTDAVFSALATFAAALYAARQLPTRALGAYALLMAAMLLATSLPSQAFFVPVEQFWVGARSRDLLAVVRRGVIRGLPLAIAAAVVVVPGAALFSDLPDSGMLVSLTVTATLAALIWPIQDFTRRMLHLGHASPSAALVSLINFVAVGVALFVGSMLGVSSALLPFGSLVVGNIASLGVAMRRAQLLSTPEPPTIPTYGALWRSGRWLLLAGAIPFAAGVVAVAVVTALAGGVAVGHAEAARIVAQPALVVATGLAAVARPRSMLAASTGNREASHKVRWWLTVATLGFSVVYSIAVVPQWTVNPVPTLLPAAFAVSGLVAVSIVAATLMAISFPFRFELVGGGRELALSRVEAIGNALRVLVAASAGLTGAFALPLGTASMAATRVVGFATATQPLYRATRVSGGQSAVSTSNG